MLPRGIRNNNPLTIRRTAKDQWKGLRAQQTDASFCQFESLEYGWRAAFYLLTRTYYHKYRLYTIRMIINKWRLVWRWRFRRTAHNRWITSPCCEGGECVGAMEKFNLIKNSKGN